MLIQQGKEEGWLHLAPGALTTWAEASGIKFTNASPSAVPERGIGLVANRDLPLEASKPTEILAVAEDLVLSVDAIKQHALFDKDLRELLDSIGDFGQTPKNIIRTFLLFQASISCPHLSKRVGVQGPFTDYVKSLPCELLPTFWTPAELQLLVGTTLAPAVSSKLKSLHREYDLVCQSAAKTRWYRLVENLLGFDDWLHVDAMFRSRALDFYGSCMIPGIDLASHAAGVRTNAFYDRNHGQYFLWLINDKEIKEGQEVCITYGDEKGACEMLFSYGFIEDRMETAEQLFLSLTISDDDMYKSAKHKISECAPGFGIIDIPDDSDCEGQVDWKGDYIWLLCVDHDDGLRFDLVRTVDGEDEEIQATFNGKELTRGAGDLRRILAESELWDVFRLRATVILQQRVFDQLQLLHSTQDEIEAVPHGDALAVRSAPHHQAMKLRMLEFQLLEKAYGIFEAQKLALAESQVVKDFLAEANSTAPSEAHPEDFS